MKKIISIILISIIAGGLAGFAVVIKCINGGCNYSTDSFTKILDPLDLKHDEEYFPDFILAAENSVKAVVHVKVIKKGSRQPASILDFIFGNGGPNVSPREVVGAGSGVIITEDGYIVTNNHVIEGADEIEVTLENNKEYRAKLMGADPATDIALLKIDEINLPIIPFGNSEELRLGEWVLAIGNPYNLRSTITAGIISAKARSMPNYTGEFKIESFIQTDAAVNSGNSGGALVNTRGELVGINTAIASKTGSYSGYSFAVPVSIVRKIVSDIIDFGEVRRALLGVTMQEVTGELAKELGLERPMGIYVHSISKGGAADMAGIKSGDIIIFVNGVEVNSGAEVQEQITKYRPKDEVNIRLLRAGKEKNFTLQLQGEIGLSHVYDANSVNIFGATLFDVSDKDLKKLGIKNGVEVSNIGNGKFKNAGIKKGFIITHINQEIVSSSKGAVELMKKSKRSILIEGIYVDGSVHYYGIGI